MDAPTDDFPIPAARFARPVPVTGAGGCLGAGVLAILARSGVPVVAMDLSDDRRRAAAVMGPDAAAALQARGRLPALPV